MNRRDSGRFCTESIESAAKRYKTLGFSIIPLHGARNPQYLKLPTIKWARFQHTMPSDNDLQNWFKDQHDIGIGIICGRISRLMVVDFDDADVASEFRHLYPDLVNTFTVRSGTRGLPHFYYRLPEGRLVTTTAYPGVDLRGEGAYVVAPPTCVGDVEWVVENEAAIYDVSEFELRRIMRFCAGLKRLPTLQETVVMNAPITEVSEFRHLPSQGELMAYYRQFCTFGRNHALFKTAIVARNRGLLQESCCFMLAATHAHEPGHGLESYSTRYAEALRTIASAYKRPPRRTVKTRQISLGNSVREWLLSHKFAALARVLDGLYVVGTKPNAYLTELEICQKLTRLGIGKRSISAALKAEVGDNQVFEVVETPLYPPQEADAASRSDDLNNSCDMSRGAKRVKNQKRGRPARYYQLPSPQEIADKIGVKATAGDAVEEVNFLSPKTYRQTLHEQLLVRRPGYYSREWLADRLGVSRWTTRRYEKAANLIVQPSYKTQKLSWSLAATLPNAKADVAYGVFVECKDGRRYPAIRGLALKLIKTGCEPILKHQEPNFYMSSSVNVGIPQSQLNTEFEALNSVSTGMQKNSSDVDDFTLRLESIAEEASVQNKGTTPVLHSNVAIPTVQASTKKNNLRDVISGVGIPTPAKQTPTFWLCPECLDFHVTLKKPQTCSRCGINCEWEIISPTVWQDTQALKVWWRRLYTEHQYMKRNGVLKTTKKEIVLTSEAKALAEKVYSQIHNLSLTNAQKIVHQFSEGLIEKALVAVQGFRKLRNPAGFLITFLRSESKVLLNNKNSLKPKMKAKAESGTEWLEQLIRSPYLSFLTNADDFINQNLGSCDNTSRV